MIEFQALGALVVTESGQSIAIGGARQRRLLAVLLIHANTVVSVDRLAEAVFAGEPTPSAATTMRSYIARLRRVLGGQDGGACVVTQSPGYLLRLPAEAFDVARFEARLSAARASLGRDDPAEASAEARAALHLWQGEAYAEFSDEDWARPEAQRIGELRMVAHETLMDAELACGRATELIPQLDALTAEHPTRESFRAQLMVALYRSGRHADALRAFQVHRTTLAEELGLEPTPSLQELERRILSHDPSLLLDQTAGRPLRGYRLGERLGTGRDGTVFAARLPGVERELAIRVIRPEIADDPEFVRTFEATAHRVASLRHPAIVALQDYWREPGSAYVVMRRLHGGTLTDRLARRPLTTSEVVSLVTRVGGALTTAAAAGVVHGAVTADNVLFDESGEPCLADFAVASRRGSVMDDGHEFAAMVRGCVDEGTDVDAVLLSAITTREPRALADLVPALVEALTCGRNGTLERPVNPYKGLRAFDESDAADYFGRRELIEEVLARLRRDDLVGRLVLLVGGSGTGKSSVVRAGVLPRVRAGEVAGSDTWFVTTMLPGASPFDALAESLRRVAVAGTTGLADVLAADPGAIDRVLRDLVPLGGQLLLVVDQFEELFTSASERDQRVLLAGLVHAMSVPDSRLRVVATLRADFYDRPLAVQGFGPLVNAATVTIAAMTPTELEAAIVEPAERVGRRVERALVAELLSAVADEPAALPALQFTLFELAEAGDEALTVAAYQRLGRVDGAIASRAEQLYQSLDEGEQVAVRRLFEHLVVIDADDEPTRRRAARRELSEAAADGSVDVAVDRWASARFLSLDRHPRSRVPTVEIAHEALLREWPRLRRWIDQDRDTLMVLGHLREAAAGWVEVDRDPGALYRGAQLQVALEVAEARSGLLPPSERDFVTASREERDREEVAETQRVARQARANRRLRAQLVVIGVALVVALVGGFIAVDQRSEAEAERRDATARSLAGASSASLVDDPERSILLALAAVDATREQGGEVLPEAIEALHEAVARSRLVLSVPDVGGPVDWSPDGRTFVAAGPEGSGTVEIRDARTGAEVLSFRAHDFGINDVAFSADGSLLATTGDDSALRLWDPATGEERAEFEFPAGGEVWGPSFSPDGSRVAASWPQDEVVRMFDVTSGREVWWATQTAHGTEFSPDGGRLAIVETDRSLGGRWNGAVFQRSTPVVVVVDAATGETAFMVGRRRGEVGLLAPSGGDLSVADGGSGHDAAWSPDGRFLATSSADGTVVVSDAVTGSRRFAIEAHTAPVNALAWSPDSARLATASDDGTARVTEIAADGGGATTSVAAHDTDRGLVSVAFSPGGDRIVTGVSGRTAVKVWDIGATGGVEWLNVAGHSVRPGASALAFTPDGEALVVGGEDGTITSWDVTSGRRFWTSRPVTAERREVVQLAVSPDGLLVASATDEGPVELWDASTGGHLRTVLERVVNRRVVALTWSHDGEVLAVARREPLQGQVNIVNRAGEGVNDFYENFYWGIGSASFSPDDRLLVTTRLPSLDYLPRQELRVWDWERGEIVRTIETPAVQAASDPQSPRIAARLEQEGTVGVWDAASGEQVATLSGPAVVNALAYGSDGSRIATAGVDGVVRLWDPDTGAQDLELRGHGTNVQAVVLSPDGTRLASVGSDGLVRVWALGLDDLISIAERRLTRSFTDAECRQFLDVDRCPVA